MSFLDAVWHVLNFLAPAAFIALSTAAGAKLAFRRSLHTAAWRRLLAWSLLPTLGVAVAGLIVTGRDGAMLTYAGMVCAAALGCWLATALQPRPTTG